MMIRLPELLKVGDVLPMTASRPGPFLWEVGGFGPKQLGTTESYWEWELEFRVAKLGLLCKLFPF